MSGEKDGEETNVVNSEPLVGYLGGHCGGGGKDGGHESGGDGGDCLHGIGLLDGREGSLDNWGCLIESAGRGWRSRCENSFVIDEICAHDM